MFPKSVSGTSLNTLRNKALNMLIETAIATVIASNCNQYKCQTSYTATITSSKPSNLKALTVYTVITPCGLNGMIYSRSRPGRITQTRILKCK